MRLPEENRVSFAIVALDVHTGDERWALPSLTKPWIEFPGYNGGSDWGGMAYDANTGILIANWNKTPMYDQLLTRSHADKAGLRSVDNPKYVPGIGGGAEGADAQAEVGTPNNGGW